MIIKEKKLSKLWKKLLSKSIENYTLNEEVSSRTKEKSIIARIEEIQCEYQEFDYQDTFIQNNVSQKSISKMFDVYFKAEKKECVGHSYAKYLIIEGENQIDWVVNTLKRYPFHRRASISFQTNADYIRGQNSIPCISSINFTYSIKKENQINVFIIFYAQDIFNKFIPDILAVNQINEEIITGLKSSLGKFKILIMNPIIRATDIDKIKSICEG